MYTLLGRVILGLIVQPEASNYIWRFFCRVTDPAVAVVALVTPKAAAPVIVWLFGVVWLFWLRVLLLNVFLILGVVPKLSWAHGPHFLFRRHRLLRDGQWSVQSDLAGVCAHPRSDSG